MSKIAKKTLLLNSKLPINNKGNNLCIVEKSKKTHFFMKKDNFINQICIGGSPTFKRSLKNKKIGTHSKPTKPKIIK
jgi:hypothetical protein